ncbi:MAG: radical SAM family heme chaperone HemW [Polyangiaceae bacterium]
MASVYVHFPYCLAKCPYCDFTSYASDRAAIDHRAYSDAIIAELGQRLPAFDGRPIESIFFGGGTPSLWDPRELGRTLRAFERDLPLSKNVEITVECNPTSLDEARARALREVGVNRLSIGVQSLEPSALQFLGRLHDGPMALSALRGAQAAGMPRISGDLIFGLPDQPLATAVSEAETLAELGLSHLSCYQLTIEPGTRFGELAKVGRLPLADDGRVAEAFLAIDEALTRRGFRHYEISNYAFPGEEARHNLAYWHGAEYMGLGTGAFGFYRTPHAEGVRYRNELKPDTYVKRAIAGEPVTTLEEPLSPETLLKERIMLGLRLAEGFDLGAAARDLGVEAWSEGRKRAADWLVSRDRLVVEGSHLRIPMRAWLFGDDTAARLF